jgi:hypothetical protein
VLSLSLSGLDLFKRNPGSTGFIRSIPVPVAFADVFLKDVHSATAYAFEVIRGFAPVKLPDTLHNFVIMESFKNPNDYQIKIYMKASESDPNKTGNSDECL